MKLSEELVWRGFQAETTIKDIATLDTRETKRFYLGADPSADSLTIGNLAAIMMCACFVRHGYEPTLLAGGATGQIGDPKETGERDLKTLEEVNHNKTCIAQQMQDILQRQNGDIHLRMVDNYDWFKDINYLTFLREVGKNFSMTQLLDRKFIQSRIGEGGSGISYAEFSYTLIQGYDFLHLYRQYGIDLQLCGADQFGNASTGIHLIKRLEGADADVWSTPLIIDPVTGRKFGKSEGNAIWLASHDNGSGSFTPVFDFYQFWLNQPDESVEYLIKIYTVLEKAEVESILARHAEHPEQRIAQKALAQGVTEVVHGKAAAAAAINLTEILFGGRDIRELTSDEIDSIASLLPVVPLPSDGINILDALAQSGLASSKNEAKKLLTAGSIRVNGEKISAEEHSIKNLAILKRGKNRFAIVE